MVAGKKAGLDLAVLLEVFNKSSGVNFATLNRFPKIITGDYLEGWPDQHPHDERRRPLHRTGQPAGRRQPATPSGPLASFGLAKALGYADQISNTVVDAIGDVSGGVRLSRQEGQLVILIPPSKHAGPAGKTGSQFTGEVFPYLTMAPTDGVTINTVNFTPCARTYWHSHEHGQVLIVLAGRGLSRPTAVPFGSCAPVTRSGPPRRTSLARGVARLLRRPHRYLPWPDSWAEPVSDDQYNSVPTIGEP